MILLTERLELVPLTAEQLELWIYDLPALERALNCCYEGEPLEGFFLEIVQTQLGVTQRDPINDVWHSFWFLIRRSDRTVVGSADFKNIPDANGSVEIGYGLGKQFEHNGYMTEAVRAMCGWALEQPGVSRVVAETETDGYASQRILACCGFSETARGDTVWWQHSKA